MAICSGSGVFMKIDHLHILHVLTFHLWGKTYSVERKKRRIYVNAPLQNE